jgi:hypothetical protein
MSYTDEDCIESLKDVYRRTREPLTREIYDSLREDTQPAASTIRNHFNNRWSDAIKAAGVERPGKGRRKWTNKVARQTINHRIYVNRKEDSKCKSCGEEDPRVLNFDHRDPEDKSFTISQGINRNIAVGEFIKEIGKCDILCYNCHMKNHNKWPPEVRDH